jgi:hypothetical protein
MMANDDFTDETPIEINKVAELWWGKLKTPDFQGTALKNRYNDSYP